MEPTQTIAWLAMALAVTACSSADDEGSSPSAHSLGDVNLPPDTPSFEPPPDDPACEDLTDYPGDCFRMAPPPAGQGYQAHYGPEDYDDPEQIAAFALEPGGEEVDCVYRVLDNADTQYFQRYTVASRPGMHHVILYAAASPEITDGMRDGCQMKNGGARLLGVLHGGIGGEVHEYPPSGEMAPENAGLAQVLDPHQAIAFELHAVNPLQEPVLRESWANFDVMDAADVTELAGQVVFNGGLQMAVPPHTTEVVTNACAQNLDREIRVTELFGHMHAHGTRFSAFKTTTDADGVEATELVYESYEWFELDRKEFNSVVANPDPVYLSGDNGARSGVLTFAPGDRLDYECEIQNTEEFSLVYALGAYTAEMCNMFGAYAPDAGRSWVCTGR